MVHPQHRVLLDIPENLEIINTIMGMEHLEVSKISFRSMEEISISEQLCKYAGLQARKRMRARYNARCHFGPTHRVRPLGRRPMCARLTRALPRRRTTPMAPGSPVVLVEFICQQHTQWAWPEVLRRVSGGT